MTHTNAQRAAVAKGARVCNIRNVNEDMMIRGGVTADYKEVKRISEALAEVINKGEWVHITTPEGTDLRFSVQGRRGYVLAGYATNPGEFSGLPDGEAACAPLEGTTEGIIVNPYLMEDLDVVHDPIRIEISKGLVTKVEGGKEAKELKKILEEAGVSGRNIAEFAFGTNPACRITGRSREDKKKLGTCHVAIGDSLSLGGTVESPMHMDIMMLRPTITVDGAVIVEDGELVFKM
jgi:leucyl aminopeptidase (aminopeptidase T)